MAATGGPLNLQLASGTIHAEEACFVWDKLEPYDGVKTYHLFLNNKEVQLSSTCNVRLTGLNPNTAYSLYVKAEDEAGALSKASNTIKFTTKSLGKVLNIKEFGAKGDGVTLNTRAIQKAINACPKGGTVLIPAGTFLSGAIFLKVI